MDFMAFKIAKRKQKIKKKLISILIIVGGFLLI
jgi:hypothetical protein